jgi:hypothetical protein
MSQLPITQPQQVLVGPIDDTAARPTIRWGGSVLSSSGTGLYGDYDSISVAVGAADVAEFDSTGITANLTGDVTGNSTTTNGKLSLAAANIETISATGAVSVSKAVTSVAGGTGYAITLAAPAAAGQMKIIQLVSITSSAVTLALTNVVGARAADGTIASTTCTFTNVSDSLVLMSTATKWVYLGGGAVCT